MPKITIASDAADGSFAAGTDIVLRALADGSASGWSWSKDGQPIAGEVSNQLTMTKATKDAAGNYVATATVDGQPTRSEQYAVAIKAADDPNSVNPDGGTTDSPPRFHPWFAVMMGVLVVSLGAALLLGLNLLNGRSGFSAADWTALEGRLKVALGVALPMTVLGVASVLVGLWMAVVEWRGRFAERRAEPDPGTKGIPENADKIIEAVGKLRGAALAMVVGALLMFGAAWIGQSAAGTASPTPTPSDSSAPSPSP
jgi:hypothetical protein